MLNGIAALLNPNCNPVWWIVLWLKIQSQNNLRWMRKIKIKFSFHPFEIFLTPEVDTIFFHGDISMATFFMATFYMATFPIATIFMATTFISMTPHKWHKNFKQVNMKYVSGSLYILQILQNVHHNSSHTPWRKKIIEVTFF